MSAEDKEIQEIQTKFNLRKQIQTKDGQTLKDIELGRLTIGDLEAVSGESNSTTKSIKMLAFSLGLSEDDIRQMDAEDFNDAADNLVLLMGF